MTELFIFGFLFVLQTFMTIGHIYNIAKLSPNIRIFCVVAHGFGAIASGFIFGASL